MSRTPRHDAPATGPDGPAPDTGLAISLDPAYLRRVHRLDELAAGSTSADRQWVHEAHAAAMRHLDSARMRR